MLMMRQTASSALCLSLLCMAVLAAPEEEIVAARLEVCEQCRLQQLPEVQRFITEIASSYPSLTVVDIPGVEPTLIYLNRFQQKVSATSVAELTVDGIMADLVLHSIFLWTPEPEYLPLPIEPTEKCIAWRQTGECKGRSSMRYPLKDERCNIRIAFDRSGYCECSLDGEDIVYLDCDHDEGSCDQYCEHHAKQSRGDTSRRPR